MNDVIPDIGGYLPVFIDPGGYILEPVLPSRVVVHRETRLLHGHTCCLPTLSEAKGWSAILGNEEMLPAILELTPEGGGSAVWVKSDLRSETEDRLARFKGCYGSWPVRTLSV